MLALVLQWAAPTNTACMQAQRRAIYERRNGGSNNSLYRWRPVRESFRERRFLLSNRKAWSRKSRRLRRANNFRLGRALSTVGSGRELKRCGNFSRILRDQMLMGTWHSGA